MVKIYHEPGLEPTTRFKLMPEMTLKREVLGWRIASRFGHGDFADYDERFGLEKEDIHSICGQRRSRSHLLDASTQEHLSQLFSVTDSRPVTLKEVLGTAKGIKIFAEWALKSELFKRSKRLEDRKET